MKIDFVSTVALDADTIRWRTSEEDFVHQDSLPGPLWIQKALILQLREDIKFPQFKQSIAPAMA